MRMLLLGFLVWGTAAFGVDYTDYSAACVAMADAGDVTPSDDEISICVCAMDTIEEEFGQDVAVISAQWQAQDKRLSEITDEYTVDDFREMMEEAGPLIDAACGG